MALLVPALRCCSLEKPETLASGEVLAAMCHLLSLVLGRVPNQILRAKFAAGSQVLCGILEAKQVRPNHRQAPLSSLPARFCSAQALHNLRARRPPPPPPPPASPSLLHCLARPLPLCRVTLRWLRTRCPAWASCSQLSTMLTGPRQSGPSPYCRGGWIGTSVSFNTHQPRFRLPLPTTV